MRGIEREIRQSEQHDICSVPWCQSANRKTGDLGAVGSAHEKDVGRCDDRTVSSQPLLERRGKTHFIEEAEAVVGRTTVATERDRDTFFQVCAERCDPVTEEQVRAWTVNEAATGSGERGDLRVFEPDTVNDPDPFVERTDLAIQASGPQP